MLMASLRDPYAAAAAAAGVGMLAASQLAQLNQLMMQQQQQHAQQLHQQASLQQHSAHGGSPTPTPLGPPLGSPSECTSPPISRTYTYKKVTKPLLERKRRARINRCLDELKELMVGALEAEGENVSKLEKADILELTVRHLQRITKPRDVAEDASRFQAGFSQCASEACHFLLGLPGLDAAVGRRLVAHLSQVVNQVVNQVGLGQGLAMGPSPSPSPSSATATAYSPPASPDQHEGFQGLQDGDLLRGPLARHQHLQQGLAPVPGSDAEVSSSTSRSGKRSRQGDEEDSDEDDEDADSDVPVNYTSEALQRQQRKRPRYDQLHLPSGAGAGPALAAGVAPEAAEARGVVSSSLGLGASGQGSQGCQSGSEDEDKGPMWRPW